MGLCAGTGLFAPKAQALRVLAGTVEEDQKPAGLASYADPLPIPLVIRPAQASGGEVSVRMREFLHQVHRDLPPTRLWGYNGMWPGPTFEVRRGQDLSVKWTNQLPAYRRHEEERPVPAPLDAAVPGGARESW